MRPTLLFAAALVLATAACSSDADSPSTTTASTTASSAAAPPSSSSAPDVTTTSSTGSPTSSDGSSSSAVNLSGLTEDQRRVVELVIDNSKSSGFVLDENCIGGLVAQLNDTDIATLLSAGADPEAEPPLERLTTEGQAVFTGGLVACIGGGEGNSRLATQAADVAIEVTTASSTTQLDRDCVIAAFGGLTNAQLQLIIDSNLDTKDPQLRAVPALLLSCVQ